ncbi:mitochondrial import receptor subunit TOM7 homolog isoform X1 [Hippopotamus amphibius kiboko]|uniref:mitochondrial import receptor subunit TOM7 homolog isoform X1 n=1 Tax=Hippopotamus amphibius kiboko TaxID=575201 RepID=UPI002594AA3C|nr:mitochondrial import receptor subunit TOM7 homolog isoform X1 [Hippopotamus amphibius kiboko]
MVKLSKEAKQRLQQLFKGGQFAIRWGFIPLVIYLGFKRGADPGMPEPTVLRKITCLGKRRRKRKEMEFKAQSGSPEGKTFIHISFTTAYRSQ